MQKYYTADERQREACRWVYVFNLKGKTWKSEGGEARSERAVETCFQARHTACKYTLVSGVERLYIDKYLNVTYGTLVS